MFPKRRCTTRGGGFTMIIRSEKSASLLPMARSWRRAYSQIPVSVGEGPSARAPSKNLRQMRIAQEDCCRRENRSRHCFNRIAVVHQSRGILKAGLDVRGGQRRKLLQNFLHGISGCQELQDALHCDSSTANYRA